LYLVKENIHIHYLYESKFSTKKKKQQSFSIKE
jgi:hypothetical protein